MLNKRQELIVQQIRQQGGVQVESLSNLFKVTTQTIRRDLSELSSQGLVMRTHGGAKRLMTTSTIRYEKRRKLGIAAKIDIAQKAAELIPDGSSVAINIGTTTESVARELRYHKALTIITNNIHVAHIFNSSLLKSLILVGGEVRLSDGAIFGSEAIEDFNKYKVDVAVIGASSLDCDGSILDFDEREVAVSKAIIANSRKRILVCDSSKFSVCAPHRICRISDLDYLVTDSQPPESFVEEALRGATELIVCNNSFSANYEKVPSYS